MQVNLQFLRLALYGFLLVLLAGMSARAQSPVQGRVLSKTDGSALAGISVQLKGTRKGTTTSATGAFTINAATGDVLEFSGAGMKAMSYTIDKTEILIIMEADNLTMNEVVVTALGVRKEVKRVGYSAQEIKGAELTRSREPNPLNGLVGKVAGLTVGVSSELLGAPQLLLRGSNISLFVVDGIPINSDTWNINPDDVESYTILKGPVASALYGYRGQNGAIIISTKRGSKDKRGFSVEFNSTTMFDRGFVAIPKVQDEYGPGDHGKYAFVDGRGGGVNDGDYDIWGPKFEGQLLPQYDSPIDPVTGRRIPTPWVARGRNNLGRFIETGIQTTNNIAVSTSNDQYDLRFSISHNYQKGIVPNTKLNITNFNINSGFNFSPRLRMEANLNYNRQFTPNFPDVQYGPNSMIYNIIIWGGADWNIDDMRNYWQPGKEGIQQIYAEYQRYNNPYFLVYEWLRGHYKNDIFGYANLTYKFNKHLELMGRTQVTTYNLFRSEKFPYSATVYGREEARGDYREDHRNLFENNTELMLKFNKSFLQNKLGINAFVGGNARSFNYNSSYTTTDYLNVPGVYSFANSRNPLKAFSFASAMQVLSAYYSVDLSWKNFLYLNATGRVDKLSTLPSKNNTYFYPSVSASTIVSEYLKLPAAISFLKLRGSYANVKSGGLSTRSGIGATPGASFPLGYGTQYNSSYEGPSYDLASVYSTGQLYNNQTAAFYTNNLFDDNLRPESRSSLEGGIDIRFLKNRLGLDISYFRYVDGPQIFRKDLSQTTGYTNLITTDGKTLRRGVEISLTGSPIKNANGLSWDVLANWSTFRDFYHELPKGQEVIFNFFRKGDRVDKYYAQAFARTPDGQIINDAGGRPIRYPVAQLMGHGNPDWVFGFTNKFHYKEFTLTFQFDGRVGGVMENYIRRQTFRGGRHIETIEGALGAARYQDYLGVKSYTGEGVIVTSGTINFDPVTGAITNYKDLQFAPNNIKTFAQDYISRYNSTAEGNLMSKTYLKLREASFTWSLPKRMLGKSFIRNASVTLMGRNLLYFVKDKRNRDVDIDQYAGSQTSSSLQTPTTRRFGFNMNITF